MTERSERVYLHPVMFDKRQTSVLYQKIWYISKICPTRAGIRVDCVLSQSLAIFKGDKERNQSYQLPLAIEASEKLQAKKPHRG